jgi:magnesium chelatase accessory protein
LLGLDWSRLKSRWPHAEASRFVAAHGLTWHVQTMGQGPAVLLIHGTGASTHSWRGVMPILARDHTVVAVDLPGHGFTSPAPRSGQGLIGMATALGDLVSGLCIAPERVAGHSAGAVILAEMCAMRAISPKALISFNGAFYPVAGPAGALFSPLAKLAARSPLMPKLFAAMASPRSVARLLNDTGSKLDDEGLALYRMLFESEAHVAATLGMMAAWDLQRIDTSLARIETRAYLIKALADRTIAPATAERAAKAFRHATVISLPGYGHLMHEENPALATRLIAAPESHATA